MKASYFTLAFVVAMTFMVGCAHSPYQPGLLYTDDARPYHATTNEIGSREGQARQANVLGLVAWGDAGISAAARNGQIEQIATIDTEYTNILGVFGITTTRVTGE